MLAGAHVDTSFHYFRRRIIGGQSTTVKDFTNIHRYDRWIRLDLDWIPPRPLDR
jgi:hypothetical protein